MVLPLGDQAGASWMSGPPMIRWAWEPEAFITQMSNCPGGFPRSLAKAICLPFGDQVGSFSVDLLVVSRCGFTARLLKSIR